jgi:hypothetical protein
MKTQNAFLALFKKIIQTVFLIVFTIFIERVKFAVKSSINIFLLLSIVIGCLYIFSFWKRDPYYLKAPTDEELISIFQQHRTTFEQLQKLQDNENYDKSGNTLTNKNKDEYKKLVAQINKNIIVLNKNSFAFATGGLTSNGPTWTKGIKYQRPDTYQTAAFLNYLNYPELLQQEGVFLRKIEGNWFIYFEQFIN